ncbi:hypothetical protein OSSY52_12510 [Tepiditoga spiralis]|uniref:HD-GYP domain-containing protein n=1 Tax=Tepiditoga spiralis TaxID=2108365 RepID=A0A7G1G3T4_9BACT|nr:HD domain-containing phosphohydrolase [Tepiditoga spiralis]BBE31110.1 hypothetical protein OSSY52_12510 [Tepiditoga spiralis]
MYNFPKIFIFKDTIQINLLKHIENISVKTAINITENKEDADVFLGKKPEIKNSVYMLINDNSVSLFIEDNEIQIFNSKNMYENIDLALIKGISISKNKNPLDLFDLKLKHKYKISKFLQGLVVTMEVEDTKTNMSHSQRVAYYCEKFAQFLNKTSEEIENIKELAMLHDIGRIGIEQLMLFTPTRINQFETWELEHTITGSIFLSSLDELWFAVPVVRGHHENWDGSGYPDGLKGEEIPYYARFIGIVDWFDIATHTATSEYEGILTPEEAIEYIEEKSGEIFDPELSKSFLKFIKDYLSKNVFI